MLEERLNVKCKIGEEGKETYNATRSAGRIIAYIP
jgi:hypothetical protein